jgi:hypothetical protein
MNHSRFGILIPFSRSVVLSKIVRFLFAIASASHCSISITLHCASAILCTFVACCTFNYTFVDSYSSFTTTFFSLVSFCIIYASTKCCSLASSSSGFSMHINVALGPVCFLACQRCLFLCKNSTIDVLIIFVLNYCLRKLYIHIIHLPFCTFRR